MSTSEAAQSHAHDGSNRLWPFFVLLVRRDLKTRYAGSTLGSLWNVIHPIVMMLIYIAVFSTIFTDRSKGSTPLDYAVHLCSGMLVWLVFSETLGRTVSVLTDNSNFLQKVWFPPMLLHASVVANVMIVYLAGFVALALGMAAMGKVFPPQAALVPLVMLGAALSAAGLGAVLSGLHVFFRDTAQVVAIALQFGFWVNPIVYDKSLVKGSALGDWSWLLELNPTTHFVSLTQSLCGDPLAGALPSDGWIVAVLALVSVLAGGFLFRRMVPEIRDGL